MKKFDSQNKPQTRLYRKKTTVALAYINEPFGLTPRKESI